MMRVSSRRKCVCMSMMNWSFSALARSCAIAGVAASAVRHVEQRPIDLVHRHERRGHAGGGLEEPAAVQALLAAEIVGHREQPRFDLALPFVLRIGIEFVAGDDLGRDRRLVLAQFGRHQRGKFGFGQLVAHGFPPCARGRFRRAKTRPATAGCQPVLGVDRAMVFSRCSAHLLSNAAGALLDFVAQQNIDASGMKTMTQSEHPLARRTLIKGARRSAWSAGRGRCDAGAGRDRGRDRRRRDLEQRILGQEGRHSLVDVSQADRRAEARRAGAAGGVLRPRLVGDLAGVRSQRARQGRIFRDERVRPLRLRLLDHGPRELRQVRPHLGQCRYRQRRRGSEGRGRGDHPRDRAEEISLRRQILRRAARRRLCDGGARSHRPPGVRRLHLQGRGLADTDQARRAARLLSAPTTCASATAT